MIRSWHPHSSIGNTWIYLFQVCVILVDFLKMVLENKMCQYTGVRLGAERTLKEILDSIEQIRVNSSTLRSMNNSQILFNHISNNCHFDTQQLANDMQIYVVTSKIYSRKYPFCFLPEYRSPCWIKICN